MLMLCVLGGLWSSRGLPKHVVGVVGCIANITVKGIDNVQHLTAESATTSNHVTQCQVRP